MVCRAVRRTGLKAREFPPQIRQNTPFSSLRSLAVFRQVCQQQGERGVFRYRPNQVRERLEHPIPVRGSVNPRLQVGGDVVPVNCGEINSSHVSYPLILGLVLFGVDAPSTVYAGCVSLTLADFIAAANPRKPAL